MKMSQKRPLFSGREWFRRDFRRDLDEMFDRWTRGLNWGGTTTFTPSIECYVDGDTLHVRADLPGVDPKDVEITVSNAMLTIRGRREQRDEQKEQDWFHREMTYGSFERKFELPAGTKTDDIKASYRNGLLELTLPMPAGTTEHKVPIEVADSGTKANEPPDGGV